MHHKTTHPKIGKFISSLQKYKENNRINVLRLKNGILELRKVNLGLEEKRNIAFKNLKIYFNFDFFY